MSTQDLGNYISAVKQNGVRLNANEPLIVATGGTVTLPAGTTVGGSVVIGGGSPITSTSANAFAVGPAGNTNPSFNVDASTASAATGLNVKSAAAAAGLAVSVISSGTNENLTVDAKGSGTVTIGATSTGNTAITNSGTKFFAASGALTVQSASTLALTVGPNNTTNPSLSVDASTASAATGLQVKSAAAGGAVFLNVLSSGTDEHMILAPKGAGDIRGVAANAFFGANANGAAGTTLKMGSLGDANAAYVIAQGSGANVALKLRATGTSAVTIQDNLAIPAAGSAPAALLMSSTASFGVYFGSGAPTVAAAQGSLYLRSDGTTVNNRAYINTNGSTTWTPISTVG